MVNLHFPWTVDKFSTKFWPWVKKSSVTLKISETLCFPAHPSSWTARDQLRCRRFQPMKRRLFKRWLRPAQVLGRGSDIWPNTSQSSPWQCCSGGFSHNNDQLLAVKQMSKCPSRAELRNLTFVVSDQLDACLDGGKVPRSAIGV